MCCAFASACSRSDGDISDGGATDVGDGKTYYVCRIKDGVSGEITSEFVEEGGLLYEPAHENKEHYEFVGWFTEDGAAEFPLTVNGDLLLTAAYEKTVYVITYLLNGGTNGDNPSEYDIDSPVKELAPATRACFEFVGWRDPDGNIRSSVNIFSDGNITLEAVWTNERHTYGENHICSVCGVEYGSAEHEYEGDVCSVCGRERVYYECVFIDSVSGETVHAYKCAEETPVNFPTAKKREHYEFKGWYADGEPCGGNYVCEKDTEFTAVYEPIKYKLDYVLNGGTNDIYNPTEFDINSLPVLRDASRDCYSFGGWYTDADFSVPAAFTDAGSVGDTTVYAKWTDPSHTYGEDHCCSVCGEYYGSSGHEYDETHVCVVCGKYYGSSAHEYDETHVCAVCGKHYASAAHVYDEAHVCEICGCVCDITDHVYGEDCVCEICGAEHYPHAYGENHICEVCGYAHAVSEHEYDDDGVCVVCGVKDPDFGIWKGGVAESFASGSGTRKDPYIITTGEELAYLAATVNGGDSCSGEYFELGADIDLGGAEWTPIGYGYDVNDAGIYENVFGGSFDGCGHVINNLTITSATVFSDAHYGTYRSVGLFGAVCGDGSGDAGVKNLGLTVSIKLDASDDVKATFVGCIAGFMNKAAVSGCFVSGNIVVRSAGVLYVGGLYGAVCDTNLYNLTTCCGFEGDINAASEDLAYVGGISGYAVYMKAEECYIGADISCASDRAFVSGLFCDDGAKSRTDKAVFAGKIDAGENATADLAVCGAGAGRIVNVYVSGEVFLGGVFAADGSGSAASVSAAEAENIVLKWNGWTVTGDGPRPASLA